MWAVSGSCKSTLLIVALTFLAACSSPQKKDQTSTPLEYDQTVTAPTILQSTNTAGDARNSKQDAPSPIVSKANERQPPRVPVELMQHWVSLEAWSFTNHFGKPQRDQNSQSPSFVVRSTNGILGIRIGSTAATWNGIRLDLAFPPQIGNGRPIVHALDALRNFEPLLAGAGSMDSTNRSIVIDPGHGGDKTGAKCVSNGRFEKEYTLDWALRLRPLLENAGWRVILTRTNDMDIALSNRIAVADRAQAGLFLSLHFNSVNGNGSAGEHGGLETYCLTPAGMPSSITREFEDNRNRAYANNAFDAENLHYAVRLHQALIANTSRRDRGIRRARFMTVLQGQNRPAVLIEGGYLTDSKESRVIATAEYRQKLAEAVAKALNEQHR
ncbi:MAG: N-acetylmuramoyl-L-alanine amidase [Pedosphaera sp.]|nr:N-acetylmuramoyl-L-alanine amidase [Pedosphaera sp.]